MTEEESIQKSKDEFISKYGKGTQLITWGVANVVRDISDDFAHTFTYHVYGNDGENLDHSFSNLTKRKLYLEIGYTKNHKSRVA